MKETIERYINGTASQEDRRKVLEWAQQSKENESSLIKMKADYAFSHLPDSAPSELATASVKRAIANTRPIKIFSVVSGIAAAVLLVLTIYTMHNNTQLSSEIDTLRSENALMGAIPELPQNETTLEYSVNSGVKGTIVLPDSSVVILNSTTTLRTPSHFEGGKRVVELDGEGYFKVRHNTDWPMYVRTQKGFMVKVTGTEFNLSSYKNDADLKLTLVTGKVSLMTDKQDKEVAVKENEEIVIKANSNISALDRQLADMRLNTSWKDGYLVFDNTPIQEFIKKVERWYGVTVHVQNPEIIQNVVTASFKSESVSQVLELINLTCGIKYTVKDTTVTLY